MTTLPDPLLRKLQPWQAALLDAIDDYRRLRSGKPWTMVLLGDALGHVRGLDARPQVFKIKPENTTPEAV